MEVVKIIEAVRKLVKTARSEGKTIGFVPTMGALHTGHISLIDAAADKCDFVVVSIFVNPTQFAPSEDFNQYPRPLDKDLEICKKKDVNVVFAPTTNQMYSSDNLTWVNVEKLTSTLCGQSRPSFFRGVATVCTKLFNIVLPDFAFFGQKDAQQAAVIKRMVSDLNMPLEIVVCPTVRQSNGLAVSSRNDYLTRQQKKDATYIYKSLQQCQQMIDAGIKDTKKIIEEMQKILKQISAIEIDYISIVDSETMQPIDNISGKVLTAVAVKIGSTRLIDNILVDSAER